MELVRVGEHLSALLAALGCWHHLGGAVLGGTAETTGVVGGRRGLMFARGLSKSRSTGLGRAGQESAERTTTTLKYQADS